MEGSCEDWQRGGMERVYAGQWYQLHSNNPLFCGSIWKLQFLQKGKSCNILCILSHVPSPSLSYAYLAVQFAEPTPDAELSPVRRLICGGAAGITSVTITYPLDIVRTRLSIQSASFAALGQRDGSGKLPGMFGTMVLMYKTEGGILALYRGIIPTVAGVAPYVSSVMLLALYNILRIPRLV